MQNSQRVPDFTCIPKTVHRKRGIFTSPQLLNQNTRLHSDYTNLIRPETTSVAKTELGPAPSSSLSLRAGASTVPTARLRVCWSVGVSTKKQRHYFAFKGSSSQNYGFSIVKYGCESWIIKKAECRRIDAFELCCSRRLLQTPWTARRSNQSILNEISPEHSLEGLMLKLKCQYFGHLLGRTGSLEKTLMLGKIEGGGRRGQHRDGWVASLTQWT